jgi:sugar phosphate isomerase/epimerase
MTRHAARPKIAIIGPIDMTRRFTLSYLTIDASPPDMVEIAAAAGFDATGVRLMPAHEGGRAFPLWEDPAMLARTLRLIEDTGVPVFDVEIVRLDGATPTERWLPLLETAGRLGARTVIAAGNDADEARLGDSFAALCEAAAPFGLSINLEFTPWAPLNSASAATRVVERAGQANGEILIDTIHVARSASTLADLRAIDPARMSYFQICDAPAGIPATTEELLFTARQERLLPGEGGVDIEDQVNALPAELIVSVEIPSRSRLSQYGAREWARRTLDSSREAMATYDARRTGADRLRA